MGQRDKDLKKLYQARDFLHEAAMDIAAAIVNLEDAIKAADEIQHELGVELEASIQGFYDGLEPELGDTIEKIKSFAKSTGTFEDRLNESQEY